MSASTPYNPLATVNLGASVAEAMLKSEPQKLGELKPFQGAGIYAIYYVGSFAPYARIAEQNHDGKFQLPIYVGKAIPAGARQGGPGRVGAALFGRLREHADTIRLAVNLDIEDFLCRYLIVDDIWIPLGESLLIAKFSPLWNASVDGFGNHDPGAGRYKGKIPRWDVIHPGRPWALKCQPRPETADDIAREVETALRSLPSHQSLPLLLREESAEFSDD